MVRIVELSGIKLLVQGSGKELSSINIRWIRTGFQPDRNIMHSIELQTIFYLCIISMLFVNRIGRSLRFCHLDFHEEAIYDGKRSERLLRSCWHHNQLAYPFREFNKPTQNMNKLWVTTHGFATSLQDLKSRIFFLATKKVKL